MKYGSVCSGIEAATVAWHPLGWTPEWFAEVDKFPSAVLSHHYPNTPNLGDMMEITDEQLGRITDGLLVGGTPCQSFSVAGLRRGMADPRGNLALGFLGLVDRARPRWVVWENVPGVLSSDQGRDFGAFLGALGKLGYGFAYRVLDAQYIRVDGYGRAVPQRRRRVFVVGHLGDWRRAAAVLLERESMQGDSPPSRKAGARVAAPIDARFGDGRGADHQGGRLGHPNLICMAHGQGSAEVVRDGSPSLTCNHEAPIVFDTTQVTSASNYSNPHPGDPYHPPANGGHPPAVAFKASHYTRGKDGSPSEVTPPLSADADKGDQDTLLLASTVRRLTPRECERLQGFPDDYTAIPYGRPQHPDQVCPDGPRYKALGNSMAVNVMRWIGRRIEAVEEVAI